MGANTWSWIAAAASVVGLWLSGQNPKVGWFYGIACQAIWVAYGLSTHQNGMVALSIAFVALYSRNLMRWRGAHFSPVVKTSGGSLPVAD
jgi:hypothetical protein